MPAGPESQHTCPGSYRWGRDHGERRKSSTAISMAPMGLVGDGAMDAQESRDAHEITFERHHAGSMIVTSDRGPDECLATFADLSAFWPPSTAARRRLRESYRARLEPGQKAGQRAGKKGK